MSALGQAQQTFAVHVAKLILEIDRRGYQCALAWAWRPPSMAVEYAKQGIGIRNSLHTEKLAIDLDLFKDGQYLADTESHRPFGEWWEAQDPNLAWGGQWGDGNHYSYRWQGRR